MNALVSSPVPTQKFCWKTLALGFLKIAWMVSCLAGLVWQSVLVSNEYLSYSTTSEVTVSNDPGLESNIPAVTFCIPIWHVLDFYRLKRDGICSIQDPNRVTFEEQLECYSSTSLKQVFNYSNDLTNKNSPTREASIDVRVTEFLYESYKCATAVSYSKFKSRKYNTRRVLVLELYNIFTYKTRRDLYEINFYFNYRRTSVHNYTDLTPEMHLKADFKYHFTYMLFKTIKQSTPAHPCIDYSNFPHFESRSDCVRQCVALKEYTSCLEHKDIQKRIPNCSSLKKSYGFYYNRVEEEPVMFPSIKNCNQCPLDCTSSMYLISYNRMLPQFVTRYADLYVTVDDTDPVEEIVFSVKLTLTEYIIYIASCIGLWFGFSIFDSICELVCKVRKLIESKDSKSSNLLIINNNMNQISNTFKSQTNEPISVSI